MSMEANPGTIEAERFVGYRKAGVTRISIGAEVRNRVGKIHVSLLFLSFAWHENSPLFSFYP